MNTEEKSNVEEDANVEEGANVEEKADALIKGVSFVISLLAIRAFKDAGYTFDVAEWIALCITGVTILFIADMMTGVERNTAKDVLLFLAMFFLVTVLFDIALLFSLLYYPFLKSTAAILIVLLAVDLLVVAKLEFFSGEADEKLSNVLWVLLFASFAVFGFYCLLTLKELIIFPFLICFAVLIILEKGKRRYSRVQMLAICLSGVLAAEIGCLLALEDPREKKEIASTEDDAEKKELPPLFAAIRDGDKEAVEKLAKTDVNTVYEVEQIAISPLMAAVMKEDAEIVDVLIKAGADVNYGLKNRDTAIGGAIQINNYEIARKLADAGAVMTARRNMSLWALGWLSGLEKRFDFRIFALLWEKKAPLFIEGTTLWERLLFPFGLMKKCGD